MATTLDDIKAHLRYDTGLLSDPTAEALLNTYLSTAKAVIKRYLECDELPDSEIIDQAIKVLVGFYDENRNGQSDLNNLPPSVVALLSAYKTPLAI